MTDTINIEEFKKDIDKDFLVKFDLNELNEEKFFPFKLMDGFLFVGVVDRDNLQHRNSILMKVINRTKQKPKIIKLSEEDFNELLNKHKEIFSVTEDKTSQEKNKAQTSSKNNEKITENKQVEIKPLEQVKPLEQISPNLKPLEQIKPKEQVATPNHLGHPKKKRLGEQLIDEGLITEDQLMKALSESKKIGAPIGSALVKLGFITLEQLRETLSTQQGINHVEAADLKIETNVIELLPEDFIKENKTVPISTDGKNLVIGMVNPNNKQTLNDIIYLTGLQPSPLILTHIEYEKCIDNFFKAKKESEILMEEIDLDETLIHEDDNLWQQVEKELSEDDNTVAKLASTIITEAIDKNASDVHIEPRSNNYVVRYRIDGILIHSLEIPNYVEASLMSRFKVMARMNIAEKRRSQDGHFTIKHNGVTYDLRVNTLPVGGREKMVIRILQPDLRVSAEDKRIQLIGATKHDIQKINTMTTSPHGVILATGPTGSGKTTTLYSVLNKMNNESVNITTVEDPVEIKLEGINQVQVNPKADITFANCMRSILRQDPDVIMVGEIRDFETLDASINAALTGHLVLSTIHTNSAAATITRLLELGAADHLIGTTLVGVIAQRLVRKLCPSCKEQYEPDINELKLIIPQTEDIEVFEGIKISRHVGCPNCNGTGYLGRIGLYEIMPVNREIRKLISSNASALEIEETAVSCGMKTLQRSGLDAIYNQETCIEEYLRVLGANNT